MAAETVAVVGVGVNNQPLIPYLIRRGVRVVVADQKPIEALGPVLAAVPEGARIAAVYAGPDYLERLSRREDLAAVYLTPGMVKRAPPLERLQARGVRLTCETDLFLATCPLPVVGITGSAGKSTTTTLIGLALERSGIKTWVGGNIGRSLLWEIEVMAAERAGIAVMELSSFQLELVQHSPQGAVWLNLRPNHLDIHGSFEAYGRAKARILAYQSASDWCVLPADDPAMAPFTGVGSARRHWISLAGAVERGAYLADGRIWWKGPEAAAVPVVAADQVRLPGRHNLYNLLAVTAAVALSGGSLDAVAEVARTFVGLPHHLEQVGVGAGITFINDSIATTPDRTAAALAALQGPLVLIAGGYDKHLAYEPLAEAVASSSVRVVVALGQTREKIARAVRQLTTVPVVEVDGFEAALEQAVALARPGDTVLLSPAAASYDMFPDYRHRGERFRQWVEDYLRRRVQEG
jgi:UDP-N-acetylmuramoylalanine--D-glutamate ligase